MYENCHYNLHLAKINTCQKSFSFKVFTLKICDFVQDIVIRPEKITCTLISKDSRRAQNVRTCNLQYKEMIFCFISRPTFSNFSISTVYFSFYSWLYFHIQKYFPLKYFSYALRYSIFLIQKV